MNVALHGLEEHLVKACSHRNKPGVIRFADDFVRHEARYQHGRKEIPAAGRGAVSLSP
jgi:hypothetical protein